MTKQQTFWKALHSLSHPISLTAILILLFNDHWLRYNYPSWLTGKLGDFTWLVFAPFIAAMLFVWLIPLRYSKFIGLLSFGFIGLWFATAKTLPFVHYITTETLYALVGWRGTLRMDASDLLTLPALLIAWWIWQHASHEKINLKPVAYVAFGLGILGTMASDSYTSVPPQAVNTICELPEGYLEIFLKGAEYTYSDPYDYVYFPNGLYQSFDGGLTWLFVEGEDNSLYYTPPDNARCSQTEQGITTNPTNSNIQYRWERGEKIEVSVDGGEIWELTRDLYELRQDTRELKNHNQPPSTPSDSETPEYLASPVSGIVHSQTGNLVLAMSRDGVLVGTPDGEWYWASVGTYFLPELSVWDFFKQDANLHLWLVITLAFLILVSTITIIHSQKRIIKIWLGLGWINWVILVLSAFSALVANIEETDVGTDLIWWGLIALASLIGIALPLSAWSLWMLFQHYRRAIIPILITAFLSSSAFIFPFLLWFQGTMPRYLTATVFSLLLTGTVLYACYVYFKPKLPERYEPEKTKRKNEEVS